MSEYQITFRDEHERLKSAVLHLSGVIDQRDDEEKLQELGLTSYAWLVLPADEAAAIERATSDVRQRCAHGWLSRCIAPECMALRQSIYDGWDADRQIDEAKDQEMERHEPEGDYAP